MSDPAPKSEQRKGRYGSYRDVVDHFATLIDSGRMLPGDRLPTSKVIQEQWDISHATATKAVRLLREALYVESSTNAVVVRYGKTQRLLHILSSALNDLESEGQQIQLESQDGIVCIAGYNGGVCWNNEKGLWEPFVT